MQHPQLTEQAARQFAEKWVDAWNAHDLDRILWFYSVDVVLLSPLAERLVPASEGRISGIAALGQYVARVLAAFPAPQFQLIDVSPGPGTLVLLYRNQDRKTVNEFMELNDVGKVKRVLATYS